MCTKRTVYLIENNWSKVKELIWGDEKNNNII